MVIKNSLIGGTDFTNEFIFVGDLNDTIDEIVRLVDNGNT